MKKIIALILTLCTLCIGCTSAFADGDAANVPEGLRSENLLLADADSSKIIYEKNSDAKIAPGGFTKLLTAAVVFTVVNDVNEKVTADAKAVNGYDFSFNNMGLLPGETMAVGDLMNGMLIYDAGEAANALAVYCSGSMDSFVDKMNAKAAEIGCTSSHFTNPSGTPEDDQYSTLKDIALIVEFAMKDETIRQIVKTQTYKIAPTNKYSRTRYMNNTNKFVSNASGNTYYSPNAIGVKTSYVSNSDCGIALMCESGNSTFLCLTANSPYKNGTNYATEDAKHLIEYAAQYYVSEKVVSKDDIMAEIKLRNGKEAGKVLLVAPEDMYINLPKGFDKDKIEKKVETNKKVKAPVTKGDALGQLTVSYNGEKISSMILVSDATVSAAPVKGFFAAIGAVFTSWIFIMIVILLIAAFVAYTVMLNKAKRKRSYKSRFR